MTKRVTPQDDPERLDDGGPLFAQARKHDPATSHEAAARASVNVGRQTVLGIFLEHRELTDEQLVRLVGHSMSPSGARTRRAELVQMGQIVDSGRRTLTTSRRKTIIWRLAR